MPRLIRVVVNRLFAENHEFRLFLVNDCLEQLGNGQGLKFRVSLDKNATICTDSHRIAQRFLALRDTGRHGYNLGRYGLFFQAYGFFNGDFAERVHRHLDVRDIHTRVIGFDAYFYVVIDNAFDRDEYLHTFLLGQPSSRGAGI